MRIAFVSNSDPSNRIARSGVPYSIFVQLNKKYDVTWLCPIPHSGIRLISYKLINLFLRLLNFIGYGIVHCPWKEKLLSAEIDKQLSLNRFDVVFSMGCSGVSYLKYKIPIFARADAVAPSAVDYYVFNVPNFAKKWALKVERNFFSRLTMMYAASDWMIKEIEKYDINSGDKVMFVPTGANLEGLDISCKERIYNKEKGINMLFVGFDLKRKGIDIAYNTTIILNEKYGINATLTIIGGVPSQEMMIDKHVVVVGKLNKNIKKEYLQFYKEFEKADLFIFPTKAEFHGIVNCEAAAFSLPIFTYNTGGVPSYCRDGINGRCLDISCGADDFANAIYKSLIEGKMNNYAKASRYLYETKFNWNSWFNIVSPIIDKFSCQ